MASTQYRCTSHLSVDGFRYVCTNNTKSGNLSIYLDKDENTAYSKVNAIENHRMCSKLYKIEKIQNVKNFGVYKHTIIGQDVKGDNGIYTTMWTDTWSTPTGEDIETYTSNFAQDGYQNIDYFQLNHILSNTGYGNNNGDHTNTRTETYTYVITGEVLTTTSSYVCDIVKPLYSGSSTTPLKDCDTQFSCYFSLDVPRFEYDIELGSDSYDGGDVVTLTTGEQSTLPETSTHPFDSVDFYGTTGSGVEGSYVYSVVYESGYDYYEYDIKADIESTTTGGGGDEPDTPTPDEPDEPDTPTPDEPDEPDEPDTPTPDEPDESDEPDTPTPDEPDEPDEPDIPTPTEPDEPDTPTPDEPDEPDEPDIPTPDTPTPTEPEYYYIFNTMQKTNTRNWQSIQCRNMNATSYQIMLYDDFASVVDRMNSCLSGISIDHRIQSLPRNSQLEYCKDMLNSIIYRFKNI